MTLPKPSLVATPSIAHLTASCAACLCTNAAEAAEKAAVFELRHDAPVPGAPDKQEVAQEDIGLASDRLRKHFAEEGFYLADIEPAAAKAATTTLDSWTACAADSAQKVGADYAATGTVYRVSEFALRTNVRAYDAAKASQLSSAVADMRGNTDESWTRAVDRLYRRTLAPRLEKIAQ